MSPEDDRTDDPRSDGGGYWFYCRRYFPADHEPRGIDFWRLRDYIG